jgi:TolA-binding protein
MNRIPYLLITIALIISCAGCGQDQYAIEKEYWKAKKSAEKIFINPYASPPAELETAVRNLGNFSQKFPKSALAIDAEFLVARLYLAKKDYEKSRSQLSQIIKRHSDSKTVPSEALFLTGYTYELENKWNSALEQYKKIITDYPTTLRGLDMPMYIAQYYKTKYQPDKMVAAYQEAITHYRKLAEKHPDSLLAFQAYNLVSRCYAALKDWNNALNSLDVITQKFKGKINLDGVLLSKALIYRNELKDNTQAKKALEQITKEYPRTNLMRIVSALLKEIEKK